MAEIPWYVWIAVGTLISFVSFFMGFFRPVSYNAFFQLMFFIGLGMIAYGYIKMKLKEKWLREEIERRRAMRGEREIEIDIDDFRNRQNKAYNNMALQNSQNFKQNYNQTGFNFGNSPNNVYYSQNYSQHHADSQMKPPTHYGTPRTHSNLSNSNSRRCPNCGTPLLKEHKFCPICNARV